MQHSQQKLIDLNDMVTRLRATSSRKEKMDILKMFPTLQDVLQVTYNDFVTYGVTTKNVRMDKVIFNENPLIGCLVTRWMELSKELSGRKLTGNNAIERLEFEFATANYFTGILGFNANDLLKCFIEKDFRCRIGAKDINKVYPDLIPVFEIALAEKFYDSKKPKHQELVNTGKWFISRKLDGVRCIAVVQNKQVSFFSRSGLPYNNYGEYAQVILDQFKDKDFDFVLDGEMIKMNDDGSDDFKSSVSQARKKGHNVTDLKYIVFDFLELHEFQKGKSNENFAVRYEYLLEDMKNLVNPKMLDVLEQVEHSSESYSNMVKQCRDEGWEGLMFRKNALYVGKRSTDILKWKEFEEEEFVCERIESDTKLKVVNGKEVEVPVLARMFITYKGESVKVSPSLMSDEEMIHYHNHPEDIVGKVISVKYKQETCDKHGKVSLQFPVWKCTHGDKRTI